VSFLSQRSEDPDGYRGFFLDKQKERKAVFSDGTNHGGSFKGTCGCLTLVKYRIYRYRPYLCSVIVCCKVAASESIYRKSGKKYAAALSKLFTKLKFNCMSKKKAEPKKNKPTKKKSSAQRKADPKKKAR
jgi:hypothetical protein